MGCISESQAGRPNSKCSGVVRVVNHAFGRVYANVHVVQRVIQDSSCFATQTPNPTKDSMHMCDHAMLDNCYLIVVNSS